MPFDYIWHHGPTYTAFSRRASGGQALNSVYAHGVSASRDARPPARKELPLSVQRLKPACLTAPAEFDDVWRSSCQAWLHFSIDRPFTVPSTGSKVHLVGTNSRDPWSARHVSLAYAAIKPDGIAYQMPASPKHANRHAKMCATRLGPLMDKLMGAPMDSIEQAHDVLSLEERRQWCFEASGTLADFEVFKVNKQAPLLLFGRPACVDMLAAAYLAAQHKLPLMGIDYELRAKERQLLKFGDQYMWGEEAVAQYHLAKAEAAVELLGPAGAVAQQYWASRLLDYASHEMMRSSSSAGRGAGHGYSSRGRKHGAAGAAAAGAAAGGAGAADSADSGGRVAAAASDKVRWRADNATAAHGTNTKRLRLQSMHDFPLREGSAQGIEAAALTDAMQELIDGALTPLQLYERDNIISQLTFGQPQWEQEYQKVMVDDRNEYMAMALLGMACGITLGGARRAPKHRVMAVVDRRHIAGIAHILGSSEDL